MLTFHLGYIPGAEALSVISKWVKRMKAKNPKMMYLLDRESLPSIGSVVFAEFPCVSRTWGFRKALRSTRRHTHLPIFTSPFYNHYAELV